MSESGDLNRDAVCDISEPKDEYWRLGGFSNWHYNGSGDRGHVP